MKHFLRKAFNGASYILQKIPEMYEHANVWMTRVMTDRDFLSIRSSHITSKPLRKLMEYYDLGQSMGREHLFETMRKKGSSGDFAPRPIMKLVLAMAYEGAAVLPRVASTYPGITALTLTAVAAGTFALSGGGQAATDLVAA